MNPLSVVFILFIRAYQLCVSPFLGANCRFDPTCSAYAIAALRGHGILKGSWLSLRRILRCHPFSEPRHDPVPTPHCHNSRESC